MEQKSSVSFASELRVANAMGVSATNSGRSGNAPNAKHFEGGTTTVTADDEGAKKLQFRKVYQNLRSLVQDLLSRERSRYGLTGRRKQTAGEITSESQPGTRTRHAHFASQTDDLREAGKEIHGNERNGATDTTTNKTVPTVLDTLSTILSSYTFDEDWDPLVNTMTAPLDDSAACIRPGLFISGFLAEQNKADLERKGITHILQMGENLTRSYEGDFEYKTMSVTDTDTSNILPFFRESLMFLDDCIANGGAALVHCYAGISRSATICIAYLMWSENLSLGAAYSLVEDARSVAQPNEGFRSQLQIFESLGSDLSNLDRYLAAQTNNRRPRTRELSSDDWDALL